MASMRHYLTGLAMTSLNPMTLVFWFVAVPGLAGQLSASPARDMPWICAGVFGGALSWVCFFATLMTAAGRRARGRALVLADGIGGIMLLAFSVIAIWRVMQTYL
jgi:threonine/homoserine/homoserine lactone efflux protein